MSESAIAAPGAGDGLAAEDRARANLYTLLGALLARVPERELLSLIENLDTGGNEAGGALAAALDGLKAAVRRADAESLRDEYHALFIGLGRGELLPYASVYLTGFLMEKPLADLRRELSRLGFERREAVKEPEDHAAAMCETMAMIIFENRLSFEDEQGFYLNYIATWLERFFADLEQAEAARFYRAVGHLGRVFLEIEGLYFAMPA